MDGLGQNVKSAHPIEEHLEMVDSSKEEWSTKDVRIFLDRGMVREQS